LLEMAAEDDLLPEDVGASPSVEEVNQPEASFLIEILGTDLCNEIKDELRGIISEKLQTFVKDFPDSASKFNI